MDWPLPLDSRVMDSRRPRLLNRYETEYRDQYKRFVLSNPDGEVSLNPPPHIVIQDFAEPSRSGLEFRIHGQMREEESAPRASYQYESYDPRIYHSTATADNAAQEFPLIEAPSRREGQRRQVGESHVSEEHISQSPHVLAREKTVSRGVRQPHVPEGRAEHQLSTSPQYVQDKQLSGRQGAFEEREGEGIPPARTGSMSARLPNRGYIPHEDSGVGMSGQTLSPGPGYFPTAQVHHHQSGEQPPVDSRPGPGLASARDIIARDQAARVFQHAFRHRRSVRKSPQDSTKPSRFLADSTFKKMFGRPPFHTYGRKNTHPAAGNFVSGDYMLTHNVTPQILPNRPERRQVFGSAQFSPGVMKQYAATQAARSDYLDRLAALEFERLRNIKPRVDTSKGPFSWENDGDDYTLPGSQQPSVALSAQSPTGILPSPHPSSRQEQHPLHASAPRPASPRVQLQPASSSQLRRSMSDIPTASNSWARIPPRDSVNVSGPLPVRPPTPKSTSRPGPVGNVSVQGGPPQFRQDETFSLNYGHQSAGGERMARQPSPKAIARPPHTASEEFRVVDNPQFLQDGYFAGANRTAGARPRTAEASAAKSSMYAAQEDRPRQAPMTSHGPEVVIGGNKENVSLQQQYNPSSYLSYAHPMKADGVYHEAYPPRRPSSAGASPRSGPVVHGRSRSVDFSAQKGSNGLAYTGPPREPVYRIREFQPRLIEELNPKFYKYLPAEAVYGIRPAGVFDIHTSQDESTAGLMNLYE